MPEQSKFEDVDLFASLNAVMKQNTGFYQSDLEIDKEIIAKAAASPRKEDKTLLWFCRPSGTHCFTGLFAIIIHPITFYCSPFFLDMSTLFY